MPTPDKRPLFLPTTMPMFRGDHSPGQTHEIKTINTQGVVSGEK